MIDVQELDKSEEVHKAWWNALLYVCEEELREAEARRQDDKARLKKDMGTDTWRGRDVGIHASLDSAFRSISLVIFSSGSTSAIPSATRQALEVQSIMSSNQGMPAVRWKCAF